MVKMRTVALILAGGGDQSIKRRDKVKSLRTILATILLFAVCLMASPAYADDGDGGVDVDIGIVSGGDVDVGIDIDAGGDVDIGVGVVGDSPDVGVGILGDNANVDIGIFGDNAEVSVNGDGLATADDLARVSLSTLRLGNSGSGGGSYEGWRFQFIKYLSQRFPEFEYNMGITMGAVNKLIEMTADQEGEILSQKYRQQTDVIALSEELNSQDARLMEVEHHRLSEMRAETRSQLEVEHQVVVDYIDYRIALVEYNYSILLGILLLMVIGLAVALGFVIFKRRVS